ncbi:MAG TPA: hypothetical protein VK489_13310 [Ferruginibacter sp.]|nr:hypothetical protein [Ferruginibacter sp.]
MKKITVGLMIFSLFFAACNSSDENGEKKDKYEQTKETMGETEKKNPRRFLSVAGSDKKNFWGKTVIRGTITNKATVASFKDIDVELSFFSKTGTLLEKDHEIIYETIEPGSSTDFKTKYYAPKGTDSVVLKIVAAKPGK